jgi:hypothetical protein
MPGETFNEFFYALKIKLQLKPKNNNAYKCYKLLDRIIQILFSHNNILYYNY